MSTIKRSPFQASFYLANTMEIFERLAWYGMYTLLASYIMTPTSQGGLGMGDTERGLIMGVVPFFLYLFPVVSGALADRFGYRCMFILAFVIMSPCYYLLSFAQNLWSFMAVFMLIALGAGIFKPVVTGTIGRTTDESNRGLGFGIFYMMVNIGGFLGPLLAPIIQKKYGWDWVFICSAFWIALNLIPAIFLYQEPVGKTHRKPLRQVFKEMQLVLGNGRLALLVVPMLLLLVAYYANMVPDIGDVGAGWTTVIIAALLLGTSLLWDKINQQASRAKIPPPQRQWFQQTMRLGNKPFMIYLLIMTGFWTVYLQIFVTLPVYIRDFVDTADLVDALRYLGPWFVDTLAGINIDTVAREVIRLSQLHGAAIDTGALSNIGATLQALDLRVPEFELRVAFNALAQAPELAQMPQLASQYASHWASEYRQVNPATILSVDFLMIVGFQIFLSHFVGRFKALPVLIAGTAILSIGLWLGGFAHSALFGGTIAATSVIIFAIGEMAASPKSQEYVASFAPKDKVAMFMGYYFVSLALGNLFAGLLSGWLYGWLARELASPMLMWSVIALLGIATCLALLVFNRTLVTDIEQQQLQVNEQCFN